MHTNYEICKTGIINNLQCYDSNINLLKTKRNMF